MLTKNILKQWQVVRSQVKKRLYVLFENNVNQLEIRSGPTITKSKKWSHNQNLNLRQFHQLPNCVPEYCTPTIQHILVINLSHKTLLNWPEGKPWSPYNVRVSQIDKSMVYLQFEDFCWRWKIKTVIVIL